MYNEHVLVSLRFLNVEKVGEILRNVDFETTLKGKTFLINDNRWIYNSSLVYLMTAFIQILRCSQKNFRKRNDFNLLIIGKVSSVILKK